MSRRLERLFVAGVSRYLQGSWLLMVAVCCLSWNSIASEEKSQPFAIQHTNKVDSLQLREVLTRWGTDLGNYRVMGMYFPGHVTPRFSKQSKEKAESYTRWVKKGRSSPLSGNSVSFIDYFPSARLKDLGRFDKVGIEVPQYVDFEIFEGATIRRLSLQPNERKCQPPPDALYWKRFGCPKKKKKGWHNLVLANKKKCKRRDRSDPYWWVDCSKSKKAWVNPEQLKILATVKGVESISFYLTDQKRTDEYYKALNMVFANPSIERLIYRHQTIDLCKVKLPPNIQVLELEVHEQFIPPVFRKVKRDKNNKHYINIKTGEIVPRDVYVGGAIEKYDYQRIAIALKDRRYYLGLAASYGPELQDLKNHLKTICNKEN